MASTSSLDLTSTVPAGKLFKANVLDGHKLTPKLLPEIVASAAFVEGDGGVGSIRQINFVDGALPFTYLKERIDVLDKENLECKLTLIEGADLGKKFESASCYIKVESSGDGGSVYKVTTEYKLLPGIDHADHEIEVAKNGLIGTFKAIEAYIIASPDYAW